jgi:AraC family transcriptional regulator, regulatory protein of adaptative response / methylated-DNA-[protein]-cysteine methyltransferase
MKEESDTQSSQQYLLVEKAIHYLSESHVKQPSLKEVAEHVGLSEFYFQRLFTQWAGISPKRFLQYLSKEYIKALLDSGQSNLDAGYQAGFSSSSQIHELFISTEGISPTQYKSFGKKLVIHYGFHHSPFGEYLLAITERGICQLNFLQNDKGQIEQEFKNEWALAEINYDQAITLKTHQQLFYQKTPGDIKLLLKGTNFQIQVWQALLNIPFGSVAHYEDMAKAISKPKASRATASAIAKNKIGYLIPCHRVIRKIAETGQYRWGPNRKKIMLALESSLKE